MLDLAVGVQFFLGQCEKLLFSLGSHFSLTSLGTALLIATAFFAARRLRRGETA